MDGSGAIDITHVNKWYGALQVLVDVSLRVEPGAIVTVMGPSGAGKSTLLRCINHLEKIDEGEILVNGQLVGYRQQGDRLKELSDREVANRRRGIGMVFQRFNLFGHLTAVHNVALGPIRVMGLSRSEALERAETLLARVGLADKRDSYPGHLSGGQQQRVAIARALAMRPAVMLFDEPTSALDPEMIGEVLAVIRGLVDDGMTMMIASHEIGFAREVSTLGVMMDGGRVIEVGTPDVVFTAPTEARTRAFLSKVL